VSVHTEPVTPDRWGDLETLFEEASATRNCWCMWWRIAGTAWRDTDKGSRKQSFSALVATGPPPGLLAYDKAIPIGWVQITPRAVLPRFNAARTAKPDTDADLDAVWALSCFYIARSHRRTGVMARLAQDACLWAARQGAHSVEAAALRPGKPLQWSDGYTGLSSALTRAGFETAEPRGTRRVLMRWHPRTA